MPLNEDSALWDPKAIDVRRPSTTLQAQSAARSFGALVGVGTSTLGPPWVDAMVQDSVVPHSPVTPFGGDQIVRPELFTTVTSPLNSQRIGSTEHSVPNGGNIVRHRWLTSALDELHEELEETEPGFTPVTEVAAIGARRLLHRLAELTPMEPSVYATREGGICIDFHNTDRHAAGIFICEPDGQGSCYFETGDRRGRARVSATESLIDLALGFVLKEVAKA